MAIKCQRIIDHIEELAPKHLAEEWDNVGLLVGDPQQEIKKVLVALDTSLNVIEEAVEKQVDMIVAHHPIIFKPIKNLRRDHVQAEIVYKVIQNNIAVYCAHTNLDAAAGGLNDLLAKKIGLQNAQVLDPTIQDTPLEIGGDSYGIGRIGKLHQVLPLKEYVEIVKAGLHIERVRVVGNLEKPIEKVALCSGAGASYIKKAYCKGAGVIVTGDIKYHEAQEAEDLGIAIIDAGHFGTEHIVRELFQEHLSALQKKTGEELEILVSEANQELFQIL